ncbi:uncharacterized protein DS421_2g48390 [Arachis hypogaea]|nr:uncharacterized protein DS421_2g48390 [Arachis hypogaea]
MASSSRDRREDEFDQRRFKSKHNERIFSWMSSKDVVPELPFKLRKDEYPEIQKIIRKKGMGASLVGTDWVLDSHGQPLKLRRGDLIPQAKGWHDIVRRSLMSTSNNSEKLECLWKNLEKLMWSLLESLLLEKGWNSSPQPNWKGTFSKKEKRKEARQEEEPQEMEEPHTLNMNQLQAALEGISGQYSQIQRSQEEQAQQQRDLWQLMDQQRGIQVQWMNQQNEYQTHMMELQQEQYAKMQEAINNSTVEHEKAMEKVIQEQAQLRIEQAQQRELLHRLDARHNTFHKEFNESRMFREARHKDRLDYDICTQEKLSYLCSTPPLLNPQIKTFNEARKIFEEQELARVRFNQQRLNETMISSGVWQREEGDTTTKQQGELRRKKKEDPKGDATTKQQGELRKKKKEDPKGKGKQGESSKGKGT